MQTNAPLFKSVYNFAIFTLLPSWAIYHTKEWCETAGVAFKAAPFVKETQNGWSNSIPAVEINGERYFLLFHPLHYANAVEIHGAQWKYLLRENDEKLFELIDQRMVESVGPEKEEPIHFAPEIDAHQEDFTTKFKIRTKNTSNLSYYIKRCFALRNIVFEKNMPTVQKLSFSPVENDFTRIAIEYSGAEAGKPAIIILDSNGAEYGFRPYLKSSPQQIENSIELPVSEMPEGPKFQVLDEIFGNGYEVLPKGSNDWFPIHELIRFG